jgi:hypothetical protein
VKERERDISEQIALGLPTKTNLTGDAMFDQRLFNTSKGMDTGNIVFIYRHADFNRFIFFKDSATTKRTMYTTNLGEIKTLLATISIDLLKILIKTTTVEIWRL